MQDKEQEHKGARDLENEEGPPGQEPIPGRRRERSQGNRAFEKGGSRSEPVSSFLGGFLDTLKCRMNASEHGAWRPRFEDT
jgi:hypothetical protein